MKGLLTLTKKSLNFDKAISIQDFLNTKTFIFKNDEIRVGEDDLCHFGKVTYWDYYIGIQGFTSKKLSTIEVGYINKAIHPFRINDVLFWVDQPITKGVDCVLPNGRRDFIRNRVPIIFNAVKDCLKYQAYLCRPDLFIDKI
jgi:hypothetical protein